MAPNRRWSCPELKAAFNAKTKAVRKLTARKSLPLPAPLFRFLRAEDVAEFNQVLGITTTAEIEYWAGIFGEANWHIIDTGIEGEAHKMVEYVQSELDPESASRFLSLMAYYRLAEVNTKLLNDQRSEQKKNSKDRLKEAKKHARSLRKTIPKMLDGISDLDRQLEHFEGQSGFDAVATLRDPAGRQWLKSILGFCNDVSQMNLDAEPELLRVVDRLLNSGQPDRSFDYSKDEKIALAAMDQFLRNQGHSANSSAKIIATTCQRLGPLRDPWEFSNKHQALRRMLKRWRIQVGQCF